MRDIGELTIALIDLLEVEARTLRGGLVRAAIAVGLVLIATAAAATGIGLGLWGFYRLLAAELAAPTAALLASLGALALAALLTWSARQVAR